MNARLLASYVLLSAPAPLVAQSNAARMANDAYTRSHDYDLIHQHIDVRNFDWDSTSLDGRVTTSPSRSSGRRCADGSGRSRGTGCTRRSPSARHWTGP